MRGAGSCKKFSDRRKSSAYTAEGVGKRVFIALPRKAGVARHPILGGEWFPNWNPQSAWQFAKQTSPKGCCYAVPGLPARKTAMHGEDRPRRRRRLCVAKC